MKLHELISMAIYRAEDETVEKIIDEVLPEYQSNDSTLFKANRIAIHMANKFVPDNVVYQVGAILVDDPICRKANRFVNDFNSFAEKYEHI